MSYSQIVVRRAPIGDPDRCVVDVYYRLSRIGRLPKPSYSGDLSAMSSRNPDLWELISPYEDQIRSITEGKKKSFGV